MGRIPIANQALASVRLVLTLLNFLVNVKRPWTDVELLGIIEIGTEIAEDGTCQIILTHPSSHLALILLLHLIAATVPVQVVITALLRLPLVAIILARQGTILLLGQRLRVALSLVRLHLRCTLDDTILGWMGEIQESTTETRWTHVQTCVADRPLSTDRLRALEVADTNHILLLTASLAQVREHPQAPEWRRSSPLLLIHEPAVAVSEVFERKRSLNHRSNSMLQKRRKRRGRHLKGRMNQDTSRTMAVTDKTVKLHHTYLEGIPRRRARVVQNL